jgi:hypothetical protein
METLVTSTWRHTDLHAQVASNGYELGPAPLRQGNVSVKPIVNGRNPERDLEKWGWVNPLIPSEPQNSW